MSKACTTTFETDAGDEVRISFDYTPGTPESGAGYMADPCGYDPGSAPELYITSVRPIPDDKPGREDVKLSPAEEARFHDENDDGEWAYDDRPDWDDQYRAAREDAR